MGKLFNMNGGLFQEITKIGNLVILNILFICCSLPVVTIGASSTALYAVTLKMVKNQESYVVKDFLHAYKKNFRQATIIWLILFGLAVVLIVDMNLCSALAGPGILILAILIRIFMLIWMMVYTYVFPVLAKFDNTVVATIKNAMVISLTHLFTTLIVVGLNCLIFAFIYFSYENLVFIIGIYSGIGIAGISYLHATLLNRVFQKYIVEEDMEDELCSL